MKMQVQYIEFLDKANLGSYGLLGTNAAAYKLGTYASTEAYLNPVFANTVHELGGDYDLKFQYNLDSPNFFKDGSIGFLAFYNGV